MTDIYLSYAREDIKKAEMLATALESQGWSVYWDRTSLLAGQDFEAVIEQAIQQAGCKVVAWSEAAKQSDWVHGEAALGRERNIFVPILFAQVEPPIAFRSLHTENLVAWEGDAHAPDFLKLSEAINACIKPGIKSSTTTTTSSKPEPKVSKNTNPRSLKQILKTAWHWLLVYKHQKTLTFIGGGLNCIDYRKLASLPTLFQR